MPEIDASPFIEQNTCASLEYQPMGCMLAPPSCGPGGDGVGTDAGQRGELALREAASGAQKGQQHSYGWHIILLERDSSTL